MTLLVDLAAVSQCELLVGCSRRPEAGMLSCNNFTVLTKTGMLNNLKTPETPRKRHQNALSLEVARGGRESPSGEVRGGRPAGDLPALQPPGSRGAAPPARGPLLVRGEGATGDAGETQVQQVQHICTNLAHQFWLYPGPCI